MIKHANFVLYRSIPDKTHESYKYDSYLEMAKYKTFFNKSVCNQTVMCTHPVQCPARFGLMHSIDSLTVCDISNSLGIGVSTIDPGV